MTSSSNPTWYDVLGVSRDASPAEIKAAWRDATDKFEPGSGAGQFRMFNDAADVLLDPARRAEYDASLDAPGVSSEPPPPAPVAVPAEPETQVDPTADAKADAKFRAPRGACPSSRAEARGQGLAGDHRRAGLAPHHGGRRRRRPAGRRCGRGRR